MMHTEGVGTKPNEQHLNMNAQSFIEFWSKIGVGREHSLLVTGYSMRPFLHHNRSVVFVSKTEPYVPRRGDIVLFCRRSGSIVLHRILRVLPSGQLLINGDAQNWTEIIAPERVLGVVTRICRTSKVFSVRAPHYRLFAAVWMRLIPIRPYLFALRRRLGGRSIEPQNKE